MRTMHTSIGAKLIALTLTLGWQAMTVGHALALTSPSYQIQDTFGSYETNGDAVSATYAQNQGGVTWYNGELSSPSYSVVTDTNVQTTSTSSSSSSSSSSGGSTGGGSDDTSAHSTGSGNGGGYYPNMIGSSSSAAQHSASSQHSIRSSRSSSARSSVSSSLSSSFSSTSLSSSASSLEADWTENVAGFHGAAGWQTEPMAQVDDIEGKNGFAPAMHFFSALQTAAPTTMVTVWVPWSLIAFSIVMTVINASFLMQRKTLPLKKSKKKITAKTRTRRMILLAILGIASAVLALLLPMSAHANGTTPMLRSYNGTLLDSSGNPVTTAVTIRFSYWKSSDYVSATDTTSTGAINAGAANYVGWQEVQTTTPTSKGNFSLNLGSVTPLVNLQDLPPSVLKSLYLQVEVKPSGAPDTAFEVLDVNSADSAVDRSQITSVPFARNADLLDQHDTGTASGDIVVLQFGGHIPVSTMAGGTNLGTYTIDADNTETSEISLSFGSALGKKLTYDVVNNIFRFNTSVEIQGDLTVTGLVNGMNLTSLQSSTGALKAFSGGGLNLGVSNGSYRLNNVITTYNGGSIALPASSTRSVFFGSGGLTASASFPTDESFIPVAVVTTSAGSIISVQDKRALSSDDREHTTTVTFTPAFEKTSYQGDGADNVGQLSIGHDNISLNNFYVWTSTKPTLQDYDILVRVPVPDHFVRWRTDAGVHPISLSYRSTSAATTDNKLDMQIIDTNGVPVTLSGSVSNLAGTSWTTSQIDLGGTPTWTPGQDMMLKLHVSAKDSYQMQIGTLKLQFVELQ